MFSFHIFFVLLYQFQETEHRNNVSPSLFLILAKVQQQNAPGVSRVWALNM